MDETYWWLFEVVGVFRVHDLTNQHQVPEAGAIVVVSFPKSKDVLGFPARVFALVP